MRMSVSRYDKGLIDEIERLEKLTTWQSAETAPKDQTIIADMGLPWPVEATWCGADSRWVYANVQVGLFHGVYNDFYFENEQGEENELRSWMPMPEVER